MKKKRQPVMLVIPPAPQESPEEVEVCEKVGDKIVCRRRVEKRKATLA